MDQEKKKELAEMDSRWDFEKKVRTQNQVTWDLTRERFNELQTDQGDLYMTVDKLEQPTLLEKARLWFKQKRYGEDWGQTMTFHHEQVYNWYLRLANELDKPVGEVLDMLFVIDDETLEQLRSHFDLGDTVNVEVNNMGDMAQPKESKVSKDELQEMINDE